MSRHARALCGFWSLLLLACAAPARAYVEIPYTLGRLVTESTNILLMQVDKVDKQQNLIIYRKLKDIKGSHAADVIKHNIGRGGFHPREWQIIMEWAEVGKTAMFMHNGGASETMIDNYWYQAYPNGEWWGMSHSEPYLLRTASGRPEKIANLLPALLAGQEIVVPCLADGDKNALQLRTARVQRLKASLKLMDYDAKRDFVGWGGDDFRQLAGMPAFAQLGSASRIDPDARGLAITDYDGDGRADFCLFGRGKAAVMQVSGSALQEASLPLAGGALSAAWADYNGDGKPDLLLGAPGGPRLFTNKGDSFANDTGGLPAEPYYNVAGAAWCDWDGDKRPDVLLANGFHGARLYRNLGPDADNKPITPSVGPWYYLGAFDNTGMAGFDKAFPPERGVDLTAAHEGKGGEKISWKEGKFTDGQVNSLAIFKPEHNNDAVVYLYREFNFGGGAELPVSFGSDDTLTVWLNGEKLISENTYRAAAPDQHLVTLKLRPGKNQLLLKICQGTGDFAFYFAHKGAPLPSKPLFEDVTAKAGLGVAGAGGSIKGRQLATADFNADGRVDLLLLGASAVVALHTPQGFVEVKNHGLALNAATSRVEIVDWNADGKPDLLSLEPRGVRAWLNNGAGVFTNITPQTGELAAFQGQAACAAQVDFDGDGKLDLFLGCLRGVNRFYRGQGGGALLEAGARLGLDQRVFNTRAIAAADLNKDGALDLMLANEGQDSVVLLGNPNQKTLLSRN